MKKRSQYASTRKILESCEECKSLKRMSETKKASPLIKTEKKEKQFDVRSYFEDIVSQEIAAYGKTDMKEIGLPRSRPSTRGRSTSQMMDALNTKLRTSANTPSRQEVQERGLRSKAIKACMPNSIVESRNLKRGHRNLFSIGNNFTKDCNSDQKDSSSSPVNVGWSTEKHHERDSDAT